MRTKGDSLDKYVGEEASSVSNSMAADLLPSQLLKPGSPLCWKHPIQSSLQLPWVAMECRMSCSWPEGSLNCSLCSQHGGGSEGSVEDWAQRKSRLKMICLVFQPPWVEPADDHGRLRTKHVIPQTTWQDDAVPRESHSRSFRSIPRERNTRAAKCTC